MRRIAFISALFVIFSLISLTSQAQATWDFTAVGSTDQTNLNSDANWKWDADKKRWCYTKALSVAPLMANGMALEFARGLLFSCNENADGNIRIGDSRMWLSGSSSTLTIPGLKKGQTVKVTYKTSSNSAARCFEIPENMTGTSGFGSGSTSQLTGEGTVSADGSVTLIPSGGLYVYSLEVGAASDAQVIVIPASQAELYEDVTTHAVNRSTKANQMQLELAGGDIKFYNTDDVANVTMDHEASTVTVTPKTGDNDIYYGSVRNISFAKGISEGPNADITNNGVEITESKGWLESAYVKWRPYSGATTYKVYVKGGGNNSWTPLDNMLVRDYGSYGRADVVGLKAATDYALKVVPVVNDQEVESAASLAEHIQVANNNREGFAHKGYSGVGAYNDDGTLKSGARVIYITKNTAKTVTCQIKTKSGEQTLTGLQTILEAYEDGQETRPLAIRLIGKISLEDLDNTGSKEEGLQVKGKNADSEMNITIEGIGEDATIYGFGFLIRNCKSVEMRNFAVLNCMDDGISLDTDNDHIWIHNIDMFYGKNKGGDHVKGDGAIDVKSDSKHVTVSYCHFWDTGKSNMFGMKSESGPNYISYHHNWFDHSDSRHPRIRTMSVHVWNNYFDGVAKYGAGVTNGASAFVEANYFRNTNKPMLSSMQGSDIAGGDGTFSSEDGGIIKSFGNVFTEKSKNFKYVTYQQNNVEFDAWEATNRNDIVPATVKAKQGGTGYDNFDTNASVMYSYTPEPAADVPASVMGWLGAGRMNHGDLEWVFDNATEDTNYEVIEGLENAITSYNSSLTGIFGGETITGGGEGGEGGSDEGGESGTTISADVECTFSSAGASNSLFTVVGNYSNSKGTAVVNGVTLEWCLKLETSTSVTFTTDKEMILTLVFGSQDTKYNIKIDGTKTTGANGILTTTLPAGTHQLTKADTGNLFYIGLKEGN